MNLPLGRPVEPEGTTKSLDHQQLVLAASTCGALAIKVAKS
jgi:hypothetical protein